MKKSLRTVIILSLLIFLGFQFSQVGSASSAFETYGWNFQAEQAVIDPGLQAIMDASQPEEMIEVIVTLKHQTDFSKIIDVKDRGKRQEALVNALQAKAAGTQGPLIRLLDDWHADGSVAEYTSFWGFNGLAVTGTPDVVNSLATHPLVGSITPNEEAFEPTVNYASPVEDNISIVNAPALWALGYRGQGVVVATMDSGAYLNHPDLVSQWRGGANSWFDPYGENATPGDLIGHGTQTLGIILGGDSGGSIIGVAPEAQWVAVKIFNNAGTATTAGIHAGFQWLLDPDGNPTTADAPHVVNNSWTYGSPGCNLEFQLDLQALRAAGILPVFSAGNFGPSGSSSTSPANNPEAFAVGAIDNLDQIYTYSSRGPSACGEAETIFPEIVAPGVLVRTTARSGLYTQASGTSLSAPHVSGALALLFSVFSDMPATQQEAVLINSAVDLGVPGPDNTFGYGRLDIWEAYQLLQNPVPTPTADLTVNLAHNKPVWVSSSQDDAHNGAMAVDENLETYWKSKKATGKKASPTEWIKIDLGSSMTIHQVVLEWDVNYAQSYNIQISDDDQTWSTIFNTTTGDGSRDSIGINPIAGRYIMVESSVWNSSSLRTWLKEFQVYGSGGAPLPTETPMPTATPTPPPPTPTPSPTPGEIILVHVGDLDGSSRLGAKNRWAAEVIISVHDGNEIPVLGAAVSGSWSGATSKNTSCTTNSTGQCVVSATNLKSNASTIMFTVSDISGNSLGYQPVDNHDPDGDSDGSSITVLKP